MPRCVMATQDGGCLVTGEIGTGLNGEEGMMMFAVKIDSEGYLGVSEMETAQLVSCYPNPGKDVLNIRTGLKDAHVEVYDMNGRLVHSQALTENVTAIDATDWAEGVYVWKVYTSQVGPSTLRVSSGTTGSATLAETGKWVKE